MYSKRTPVVFTHFRQQYQYLLYVSNFYLTGFENRAFFLMHENLITPNIQ